MGDWKDQYSIFFRRDHLVREFVCGGIGGATGIFIGFPLDLIKVKLQVYPTRYRTAYDCFKETVNETGYRGLYNGCLIPVLLQGLF
jgi:hypothetical protein